MNEITFIDDCEICGKKDTPCRNHHMVPQRLMKILPKKRVKQYTFWKLKICDTCNNHLHPENKLYNKIKLLESVIEYHEISIQATLDEINKIGVVDEEKKIEYN